jgi:hypothetical protein
MPDGIDVNAAQAVFKSGVLTLTIPKTPEAQSGAKHIPAIQLTRRGGGLSCARRAIIP